MADQISDEKLPVDLTATVRKPRGANEDTLKPPPATDEHILRAMLGRPLHDRPADAVKIRKAG